MTVVQKILRSINFKKVDMETNLPGLGETRSLKEPYVMRAKKSEKTNAKNVSNIFWAQYIGIY